MKSSCVISEQFLFDFDLAAEKPDPVKAWREARARELETACLRLGAPLRKKVEVRLTSGKVLRGVLELAQEGLWMEADRETVLLAIGPTTFRCRMWSRWCGCSAAPR